MRRFVVFLGLVLACVLPASVVIAQDASPAAGGPPGPPDGCSVVASGLVNPRYVAVAEDGTLYVTEAGSGGDEVLDVTAPGEEEEEGGPQAATPAAGVVEEASPAAEEGAEPPLTRGLTGQVTMVSPEGEQSVLATGLASYSFGSGPVGLVLADGDVWVAVGGAAASLGLQQIPTENSVVRIDAESGEMETVAELGTYEVINNPDGTDVNPNLYGMVLGADGMLYVADAGGNTVYSVDPASGDFELVDVVPGLSVLTGGTPVPSPVPGEPGSDRHSVPTGLAVDADGLLHIALLSEMWPPDAPSIVTLEDGAFSDVADGLAEVVALAVGPDGSLYASQLTTDFAQEIPAPGSVLRILPDGSAEVAVDGLFLAHGITFDAAGNLYVVTNSVAFGPGEPQGQVLRCEAVASPAANAATGDAA